MRRLVLAAWVAVGLGFAGLFAAEPGARELHLNAVVLSMTTEATQAGEQVRVLKIRIPEKNDDLTFTIPASNKELYEAVGALKKDDKLIVAIVVEDGKQRPREFKKVQ